VYGVDGGRALPEEVFVKKVLAVAFHIIQIMHVGDLLPKVPVTLFIHKRFT
jgi:hypothetical protein